jgi:hypothetical protein
MVSGINRCGNYTRAPAPAIPNRYQLSGRPRPVADIRGFLPTTRPGYQLLLEDEQIAGSRVEPVPYRVEIGVEKRGSVPRVNKKENTLMDVNYKAKLTDLFNQVWEELRGEFVQTIGDVIGSLRES